jgi:hypothetical protein
MMKSSCRDYSRLKKAITSIHSLMFYYSNSEIAANHEESFIHRGKESIRVSRGRPLFIFRRESYRDVARVRAATLSAIVIVPFVRGRRSTSTAFSGDLSKPVAVSPAVHSSHLSSWPPESPAISVMLEHRLEVSAAFCGPSGLPRALPLGASTAIIDPVVDPCPWRCP